MLSWFGRLLAQTPQGAFRRERRLTVPRGSMKRRLRTTQMEMFIFIHTSYWPRMRSRWLDTGQDLFCDFIERNEVEVNKKAKKKITRTIFNHLDRTILVNKRFITWPKRELLLAGTTREIPSGQDEPILPFWIANQNAGFASSRSLAYLAI